jgi:DNA-binding MarR family transcriptional regulator
VSWSHVKSALESDLKGLDKFVLIILANHVNDKDGNPKRGLAWPSVTTLVKEAGISRATVNRVLNRLEAGGYLAREHHGTRSTHYRLSVSERDIKLLKNPVRRESSPQRELSSSLSALGSEQSNPASSAHDCARGGSGVKSADAKNEEKRWRLYQEHIAELEAAGYQTAGMDPPQAAIAVIDLRIENKKKSQSLRLQNEKNGPKPNAALTSGTANGAPCQEP